MSEHPDMGSAMDEPAMESRAHQLLGELRVTKELSREKGVEVFGLLHLLAEEIIRQGRNSPDDMREFVRRFDPHRAGIRVQVIPVAAWYQAARGDTPT